MMKFFDHLNLNSAAGNCALKSKLTGPDCLATSCPTVICYLPASSEQPFSLKKEIFYKTGGLRGFPLTEKQICPPKGKKMIFSQFERSKQRASVAVFKRPTRISYTLTHTLAASDDLNIWTAHLGPSTGLLNSGQQMHRKGVSLKRE
jgi:hypothetical protein